MNNYGKSNIGGKENWIPLPDERLPQPTYWPAVMAVGITSLLWGLVTSLLITLAGGILMAVSVLGWIESAKDGQ
jgi:hypothetical protein